MIDFTKRELEILRHRLDVGDAIAEVLSEEGYDYDIVEMRARELSEAPTPLNALDRAILRDAVEGNTWLASLWEAYDVGDITRSQWRSHVRSARSLADKLRKAGIANEGMPEK